MNFKLFSVIIIFFLFLLFFAAVLHDKPTVYLIGDSTMSEKQEEARPETGWGEMLPEFFNDQIEFENHARNGRSTKSFIDEGRWETVYKSLSEGDYVFIQFGHNDEKEKSPERYTTPEQYKNNLIMFIKETREKGAVPVLLTPIVRRRFNDDGKFYTTHGKYPDTARNVADELKVPLIDHQKLSRQLLEQLGEEKSKDLYLHLKPGEYTNYPGGIEDDTHFSPKGAGAMAELAVNAIKQLNLNLKTHLTQ